MPPILHWHHLRRFSLANASISETCWKVLVAGGLDHLHPWSLGVPSFITATGAFGWAVVLDLQTSGGANVVGPAPPRARRPKTQNDDGPRADAPPAPSSWKAWVSMAVFDGRSGFGAQTGSEGQNVWSTLTCRY